MNASKLAMVLLLGSTALLGACGGGGDDGSPGSSNAKVMASPEGVYIGGLGGAAAAPDFQGLVLENNEFWTIYGEDLGSVFYVYGFVQGQGVANNGNFSAGVRDFGFSPALSGSMTASYNTTTKQMAGSVNYGPIGNVSFAGGPLANSLYVYGAPASLSTITGAWSAMSSYGSSVAINVSPTGTLTLKDGTCTGSGTVTPRASGKNVYDVRVTFGFNGCALPGAATTGIAIAYPLSTGQTQIIAAITNSTRTEGIAVFGIR
jgi:hypothetical protein